jgi:hypothetical protein
VADCKEQTSALVELARRGVELDSALRAHLASCEACESRWQAEVALADQFRSMRAIAMASSAASQTRRDIRAAGLMKTAFTNTTPRRVEPVMMPSRVVSWGWLMGVAAALLLAVGLGYLAGARPHQAVAPVYEASVDDGFVDVPFALPPVPGEVVRIVHSDLDPQMLATMGIDADVDPDADSVGADVMVGEDGLPRAVRITEASDVTQF